MSERDRDRRRQSPSANRDRDRNHQRCDSRDRDGPAGRDPFGRDESRRGKYNSPYPDTTPTGGSGANSSRYYDNRHRRQSPSSSPSPPPRGGREFRGRGDTFRRRPSTQTTRNFNFSEEDFTQPNPGTSGGAGRRDSRVAAEQISCSWSSTGTNSEALSMFEQLRSYTPYLLKRRKQIRREGKERQFADQLDDIKFWLDSARDIKSDQTLGVNGLRNCLTGIMEMARLYPTKKQQPQGPQVFNVSSGEEVDGDEDQDAKEYAPHSSYGHAGPKSESPRPEPQHPPRAQSQRNSAIPKAEITTNWNYDPSQPDSDEELPMRVPPTRPPPARAETWNRRREEDDEAFFSRGHVGGSAGRQQREREQERTRARNPSPPPQQPTRSNPVTPNQRQADRRQPAPAPPVYNPFDQLSDDDEDNGANDEDIFGSAAAGPSSPTPSSPIRGDDDFESMYQRPVRRPQTEPEPDLELQQQQRPGSSSFVTSPTHSGFTFPLREHGFPQRPYNPESGRRALNPEHLPGPEIPLDPSSSPASMCDPRVRQAPAAAAQIVNGYTHPHAHAPDPRQQVLLGAAPPGVGGPGVAPDPRLARQAVAPAPSHLSPPIDPRLGPQRASTYATPGTGAPMPMHPPQQQPPLIDPVAALAAQVTHRLSAGVGLTPEQQQMLAINLTVMSAAGATGVAPQPQLPFPAQQQGGFPLHPPPGVGFPGPGGQFMPQQAPPLRNPYPGAPTMPMQMQMPRQPPLGPQGQGQPPGGGAPSTTSKPAIPEINQELLNAQFRAKAAMCFSRAGGQNRPNSGPGGVNPPPNRDRPNFINPKRFTGPSRHGAPNRFPFKQDLPPRRPPAAEEARRREREAEERELARELAERERSKATESNSSKDSALTSEKQAPTPAPLIATNQIPATVRPGKKNRVPNSQKSSSSGGSGASSVKNKELERTLQRVKDRLHDLMPPVQKVSKIEELRANALRTLPGRTVVPQSVAARKRSRSKSTSVDQRSPEAEAKVSDSDQSPPAAKNKLKSRPKSDTITKTKVQKDGVKRRRIIESSSSSGSNSDADGDSQQITSPNPSPAPVPSSVPVPTPPPLGTTDEKDLTEATNPERPAPPPPQLDAIPATPPPMAAAAVPPTNLTSTSPSGKKSGSRELTGLQGYLREMNFEAHMPTGPRRRAGGAAAASEVPMASSALNSSFNALTDTINAVAAGGGTRPGLQLARKKTKAKAKGVPKTPVASAGRGRGRGRPRKYPIGAPIAPKPKKKVGRPSRQVLDALSAAEAVSALLSGEQRSEIEDMGVSSFDVDAGGRPGEFGGVVIGPNDLLVNPALGKIKMESDYVPPRSVKTEPPERPLHSPYSVKTEPSERAPAVAVPAPTAYPRFNFGHDEEDDDAHSLPPGIKLEPEDVDVDPDVFGAMF